MFYWFPAIVWMAFIYYLSGRTGEELGSMFPFIKDFNPGHILAYFILAWLVLWPLRLNKFPRPYLATFLLCLFYGISDEIHQYFVPTRTPDVHDLLRDLLGAAIALTINYFLVMRKNRKQAGE
nr:VanZ family protein [Desulfotruncus alcoholivorax]